MDTYTIPAVAAYSLLAAATRSRSRRGTMEAFANMEAAAKRRDTVTVRIAPTMAWLESGLLIGTLYPVQARRWLYENGYKES